MPVIFRDHYFADSQALASFERYAKRMFDLDFTRWKDHGLWDPQYQAFSAFDGLECIASMCVYPSVVTVDGIKRKGIQLLTVGTQPPYRRQGIQRELWKRVQDWASKAGEFIFLFTDEAAASFYQSLGLEKRQEHVTEGVLKQVCESQSLRFRKLVVENAVDYSILRRLAHERQPVSYRLGVWNPNRLLFKILYSYQDKTYYLEDYDTVVVVSHAGDTICVHDIIATQMPKSTVIERFIGQLGRSRVRCLFCADRFSPADPELKLVTDRVLMTSGELGLEGEFVFPYSAET